MDEIAKKKWYLYVGDHQEGPFSLLEIREKVLRGAMAGNTYAWTAGMADWLPLDQISSFQSILNAALPDDEPTPPPTEPAQPVARPTLTLVTSPIPSAAIEGVSKVWKLKRQQTAFIIACFLIGAALFSLRGFLGSLRGRAPLFTRPAGITDREYGDLIEAATTNAGRSGVKAALVAAYPASEAPTFYVASNAPDGTEFKLEIDGVPGMILSQSAVRRSANVTITHGLGHTESSLNPAEAYPEGEYRAFLSGGALTEQVVRTYFIGIDKRTDFDRKVTDMRRKMTIATTSELTEYRKFQRSMRTMLDLAAVRFNALHSGKNSAKRALWDEFELSWAASVLPMELSLKHWAQDVEAHPGTVRSELALSAQQAWAALTEFHSIQHQYFLSDGAYDTRWSSRLGVAGEKAVSSIADFKTLLEQSEKSLSRGGAATVW